MRSTALLHQRKSGCRSFRPVSARHRAALRDLRKPVEQVSKTAQQVEQATKINDGPKTQEVVVKGPTLTERLFGTTQSMPAEPSRS